MKKLRPGLPVSMSPPLRAALHSKEKGVQQAFQAELKNVGDALNKMRTHPAYKRGQIMTAIGSEIMKQTFLNDLKSGSKAPTCQKGCSHCCYQNIEVTFDEAALLLKKSENVDWDKVKKQSIGVANLEHKDRACVFLKDNECSVYDNRPMNCRKYFVISDPEKCDSEKYPAGDVEVMYSMKAEMFSSACMTFLDSGPLPNMLLHVKEKLKL